MALTTAFAVVVIGGPVAVAARLRRSWLVGMVGVALVATAGLLAWQLRQVDTYFNEPGRTLWDNRRAAPWRLLVVASLATTALLGGVALACARPVMLRRRFTMAVLAIAPLVAIVTAMIHIAYGAH